MSRAGVSWRAAIVVVLLVAFALRAHRLDGMSLWSDEDITSDRAALTVPQMLAELPAEHTPVYFLTMIPWTRAVGASDFALRLPSLMAGVLAVAAAAAVGSALAGKRAAVVFAFIMAINPFLVWYGQEARMYALLSALGLLSIAAALVARRTARSRWWVACGVLAALTVLVHYYGVLTVAVLGAWGLIDWRSRRAALGNGPAAYGWLIAGAAALLVFAPWVPRLPGLLDYPGWREPVALADVPRINIVSWTAGETATPEGSRVAAAVYLALAAAGGATFALRARRAQRTHEPSGSTVAADARTHGAGPAGGPERRLRALFALAFVAAPVAVAVVAVVREPDFHPRYFTAVVPALYLWTAAGATRWRSPALRSAAVVALLFAAAQPLSWLYGSPSVQKQDYRSWVRDVESWAGHEDTVLFLDGPSYGLTRRYEMADSPVKIVNLKSSGNLEQTREERLQEVAELARDYPHLWLATTGEALGEADLWLESHAFAVDEPRFFQGITLERYLGPASALARRAEDAPPTEPVCPDGVPVCASFRAPSHVVPEDILPVVVVWSRNDGSGGAERTTAGRPEALAAVKDDARVSLRLVDASGEEWVSMDRPLTRGGESRLAQNVGYNAPESLRIEAHVYRPGGGELGRFAGPAVAVEQPGGRGD